jgi:osmotically-inducible protein OsmY
MDMRRYQFHLSLLAGCAAVAVLSAQQPPPSTPPAADVTPTVRERRNVSDAHLGLEVQARLSQELGVSNLSALVRQGVATLDGIVQSENDRQRAEQLALEVDGVDSVLNELSVASPTAIAIANEAAAVADRESTDLEAAVTQRLQSDAVIGSRAISVEADELTNTITLNGIVTTQEEKDRAGQLAVEAFPAGQVRNQLEVRQRL